MSVGGTLAGQVIGSRTVVAAGSSQATAGALPTNSGYVVNVTGADGTKAVRLPVAAAGKFLVICNQDASTLPVYPAVGDAINGGSVDAAVNITASKNAMAFAISSTNWVLFASA